MRAHGNFSRSSGLPQSFAFLHWGQDHSRGSGRRRSVHRVPIPRWVEDQVLVENRDMPLPGQAGYDRAKAREPAAEPAGPVVWVRLLTPAQDRLADETAVRRKLEEQRRLEEARHRGDPALSIPGYAYARATAEMDKLRAKSRQAGSGITEHDVMERAAAMVSRGQTRGIVWTPTSSAASHRSSTAGREAASTGLAVPRGHGESKSSGDSRDSLPGSLDASRSSVDGGSSLSRAGARAVGTASGGASQFDAPKKHRFFQTMEDREATRKRNEERERQWRQKQDEAAARRADE